MTPQKNHGAITTRNAYQWETRSQWTSSARHVEYATCADRTWDGAGDADFGQFALYVFRDTRVVHRHPTRSAMTKNIPGAHMTEIGTRNAMTTIA